MRYLCAVGAPWGLDVVQQVQRTSEQWELVRSPEALRWTLQDLPAPRFVFCLNWSLKVSPDLVSRFEFVNLHSAPLPFGRGGHPIENMLLHCRHCRHHKDSHQGLGRCCDGCDCRGFQEHEETVITAHRMSDDIDAGPKYLVSEPVSLSGQKARILERFIQPCSELIRHLVRFEPTPKAQVGRPTYFKRLSPEAYRRFWSTRG